jgi:hypothetical protein
VIQAHIAGDFEGYTGTTVFKLDNRQYWQQASFATQSHYAFRPGVTIMQDGTRYLMQVDGVDGSIAVVLLDVVVESQIMGTFKGWTGDTTFELVNGQVWKQAGLGIETTLALQPDVMIFRSGGSDEIFVEKVDSTVQVVRLK